VEDLIVKNERVIGVETASGELYHSERVVLTTGTFLRGEIHIGRSTRGGRKPNPVFLFDKRYKNSSGELRDYAYK